MNFISLARHGGRVTSGLRRLLLVGLASTAVSVSAFAGGNGTVDRGPTTLSISADLNGLYWDKNEQRLFVTNNQGNHIQAWDGGTQFSQYAMLPQAPASGAALGEITRTADGTLYVTRFGFGKDGAVIAVPRNGAAVALNGTDPQRRRVGITVTPDDKLLGGWFAKGGAGAVSELALDGTNASERELITGLGKPVGLAVVGDNLYVSDQNTGDVLSFSLAKARAKPATLADGKLIATFTTLDGIDLMTSASDGSLFFGGSGGKLFRISPKGEVSVLASGWPKIRGVAYDEANRRLFVAVVAADSQSSSTIRIVPVN